MVVSGIATGIAIDGLFLVGGNCRECQQPLSFHPAELMSENIRCFNLLLIWLELDVLWSLPLY